MAIASKDLVHLVKSSRRPGSTQRGEDSPVRTPSPERTGPRSWKEYRPRYISQAEADAEPVGSRLFPPS